MALDTVKMKSLLMYFLGKGFLVLYILESLLL
jgi:hypothetical protein